MTPTLDEVKAAIAISDDSWPDGHGQPNASYMQAATLALAYCRALATQPAVSGCREVMKLLSELVCLPQRERIKGRLVPDELDIIDRVPVMAIVQKIVSVLQSQETGP